MSRDLPFTDEDRRAIASYRRRIGDRIAALEAEDLVVGGDEPFYGPLSPQQLAALDRALNPAEQADVDKWQSAQATAMQVAEELKPFTNPLTGKLTRVSTAYTPEAAPPKSWWSTLKPWQQYAIAGAGALAAVGILYAIFGGRKSAPAPSLSPSTGAFLGGAK
jgi:anti-sigma factor RsiW